MFEINFLYSADGRIGKNILTYIKEFLFSPSGIIVVLAVGGIVCACRKYCNRYIICTICGMFIFSVVCMSVSLNANPIYYTVYMPFIIPLIICMLKYSRKQWIIWKCVICLILTVGFNMQLVKKIFRLGSSSYAYESAYQMEELIENKEDLTLVLGNSMYYNCTATLPHIKYFTIFGSGLRYETFPHCIDEQFESLCSGENKYVIIEYVDEGYLFWSDAYRNERMNEYLNENYHIALEYFNGGIHSALWVRE